MKLIKEFGSETLNKVKRNPYVIMEVDRISFEKADTIALDMGLSKNSTYRMSACLIHTLNRLCNSNGHSFIDENLLIKETLKTLNANTFDENELVDREKIVDVLDRKSTRLNSSHVAISYAVFCLKKKKQ